LAYLNTRGWTIGKEVTVKLGHTPKYERIAAKVEEMSKKGASVETIGRVLGTTWGVVRAALTFTRTGKRPYSRPQRKRRIRRGPPKAAQYVALSPQVAQLQDEKRFPFAKIAKQLNIHKSTATRAYDYAHQEALQRAAEKGQTPHRGQYSHISTDVYKQIFRELKQGKLTVKEIAVRSGVGISTVYREKYKLNGT
jgi:hypothetical protein